MSIHLGDIAPDFEQETTIGRIRFHEWLGDSWGILFSHPKDFTPVCTTELGAVAKLAPEWAKRGTKVIGLSVDPVGSHAAWAADIADTQGATVDFPIIADADGKVAALYDMIHPAADPKVTVRTVFIIDPAKKVRLTVTYAPSAGRNFDEILRVLDSLQLTDRHKVTTPANWRDGEDVIIAPSVSDEQARTLFPTGWKTLRPYLRLVAQPR
ncbi:peroxiredoxin [Gluconacetobacter sacchari]|uniref:peroxiredoxin n=1 Tax=Gluconacetobacter sacchari TaxID=92759 RepID=UPI0039B5AFD4